MSEGGGGNLRGSASGVDPMDGIPSKAAKLTEQMSWNPFRYMGDYLHLFGRIVLLATIFKNKSVRGISRSTQILYAVIFCCRYLDLATRDQVMYLVVFKIIYIVTSLVVLGIFWKLDSTYERQKDTCSLVVIVVPCITAAFLLAKDYDTVGLLWALSQFLEGFAMVPQYIFCYRDRGTRDVGITLYVVSLGGYRVFYAANWIYKKLYVPNYTDIQSWLGGIIEIAFFCDYLLSFSGFSALRTMVLKVDEKINEIQGQVELKVLGRVQQKAATAGGGGSELRQRRRGDGGETESASVDI
mmetsp:Transcript_54336/g.129478  ORF Transcript_54336/g.129478 Transcript_54336/m.129478 type:complete len:298 (+) Transcript_54336:108-1001(+)